MKQHIKHFSALTACLLLSACGPDHESPVALYAQRAGINASNTVIVKRDDTIYSIAYQQGISTRDLIAANNLQPPYTLVPGQFLRLPTPQESVAVTPSASSITTTPLTGATPSSGTILPSAPVIGVSTSSSPAMPNSISVGDSANIAASIAPLPPLAKTTSPDASASSLAPLPPLEKKKQKPRLSDDLASELESESMKPASSKKQTSDLKPSDTLGTLPATPSKVSKGKVPSIDEEEIETQSSQTEKPSKNAKESPLAKESGNKKLLWPVRGKVLAGYGAHVNGKRNDGINIEILKETPVYAAEEGIVIYAGNELKAFGNLVLIKHPHDLVTAYAHLDKIMVSRRQKIGRGAQIATVGKMGNQLHFSVRQYMDKEKKKLKTVDPTLFLAP